MLNDVLKQQHLHLSVILKQEGKKSIFNFWGVFSVDIKEKMLLANVGLHKTGTTPKSNYSKTKNQSKKKEMISVTSPLNVLQWTSLSIPVYLWHLQSGSQSGPMKGRCSAPACSSPPENCWSASGRSETTEEKSNYTIRHTCSSANTHVEKRLSVFYFVRSEYTFHSYTAYKGVQFYLLWSVDIFVESFEGINVELHELSKQIKVAL